MAALSTWLVRATGCTAERQNDAGRIMAGLFGIKNTSGFDVEMRQLYLEFGQGRDGSDTTGVVPIWRLTALAGGEKLTVVKHDTNSATLPSQVAVVKHPDTVTMTDYISGPGQLAGIKYVGPTIFRQRFGAARDGLVAGWFRSRGNIQPIVLREGQGIAWTQSFGVRVHTHYGTIFIRNQASGATYTAFARPLPTGEQDAMIAVFNGVGSGVILEVLWIESHDVGYMAENTVEDTQLSEGNSHTSTAGYRVVKCSDLLDGEAVTPVAMDTNNSALGSGITCLKNPIVIMDSAKSYGDSALMSRLYAQEDSSNNNVSNYNAILLTMQHLSTLRAFERDPTEPVGQGSANFPRTFEGPYRDMFAAKSANMPGLVIKTGECVAVVYYFRHEFINDAAQTQSDDEGISSLVNYNIAAKFTASMTTGTAYYYRAYDTGTAGYVYWGPYSDSTSGLNPTSTQTTPNFTGSLQNQHIYLIT